MKTTGTVVLSALTGAFFAQASAPAVPYGFDPVTVGLVAGLLTLLVQLYFKNKADARQVADAAEALKLTRQWEKEMADTAAENARLLEATHERTKVLTTQQGVLVQTTSDIEKSTNGHLSILTKDLAAARQEIKDQQVLIATNLGLIATLAEKLSVIAPVVATPTKDSSAVTHLQAIEQHTGDTAQNTARTDAAVKDLKDTSDQKGKA